MFNTRALAAAVVLALAGFAAAPASAAVAACNTQQGFHSKIDDVWHHYVWIKEKDKRGRTMYRLFDCGLAF